MATEDSALAVTVASPAHPPSSPRVRGSDDLLSLSMRSTVLPRLVRVDGTVTQRPPGGPRFAPVRLLGRGGLGEVTLVHDNDIDRPVALKRLIGKPTDELVFRFAEEIRIAGQLEHPNIAPLHDVGVDDDGRHYFVMRYIEGETLEAVIQALASGDPAAHQHYTFERRVELFFGILHAIQYSHARGIIHRDIKPANIMLGPYGEVLVMDWGIAKSRGAVEVVHGSDAGPAVAFETQAGSLVGTPSYMSPEQASGDTSNIDERSDIYSLCVLFYELLALQHYLPQRATVPELLTAIVSDDHVMASRLEPNRYQSPVPAELGWYVEKGLAKDRAARYQSVTEMIDHLHRVMSGQFAVQCPVTFMKRVGGSGVRFADRNPVALMIGLGSFAALVGFAVFELVRMVV